MRKPGHSVDQFRSLLDASMEVVIVLVDTRIAYINRSGAKLFGFDDPSEVIGKDILEFHYPEDLGTVKKRTLGMQRGESHPSRHVYSIRIRDGTRVEVETNSTPIKYEGKPAVLAFVRDVTERNVYGARLEALHRHATELGKAKNIDEVSKRTFEATELVFGFTRGGFGVVEDGLIRYLHLRGFETTKHFEMPLDGPGVTVRTVKTGKTQRISDIRLDKDFIRAVPEERLISLSELSVPVKVGDEVVAIINLESTSLGAFTEEDQKLLEILAEHIASVISRLRYSEMLRTSEERYRTLVENLPDAISVTRGTEIVYANPKRAELVGLSDLSELIGSDVLKNVVPEEREAILRRMRSRERGEDVPSRHEFRMQRADGSIRDVVDYTSPILYEGQNAVQHILRDVTEQVQYEKKLEALHTHAVELESAVDMETISESTLEAIEYALGFSIATFAIVDDGNLRFIRGRGLPRWEVFCLPLDGPGTTIRAVRTGETQLVSDTRMDPDFVTGPEKGFLDILSELDVPIKVKNEVVVIISIVSAHPNAFNEQDEKLLEILAGHVASAIRGLHEQTERRRYEERLETLHRHVYELGMATNIDDVTAATFRAVQQTLGYDRGSFGVVEDNFIYFKNFGGQSMVKLPLDGPGVTVRTVRTGETQLVPDVRMDKDFLSGQPDAAASSLSELDAPVKVRGKVVALINIESSELNAFTEQDKRLLEIFAEHVASAMLRLRNEEERRHYEDRLEALHGHATELGRTLTLEEIGDATFKAIERIISFEQGTFGVVSEGFLKFLLFKGVAGEPKLVELPLEGPGITIRAVKKGETQRIGDIRHEKDFVLGTAEGAYQPLSELAVPVKVDGQVVAVINLESRQIDAFSEHDQSLLETLSLHVASAYQRIKERAEELKYEESLTALHRHATELGSATSMKEIGEKTFNAIEGVLGLDLGSFLVVEGGNLNFIHTHGYESDEGFKLPLNGPGVTVRATRTGATQLVPDVRLDKDFTVGRARDRYVPLSELAIPVKVGENVVAVINVESIKLSAFTVKDQRLLEIFAEHVASAIRGLREQEEHKRYEERLEALQRHIAGLDDASNPDEIAKITLDSIETVLGFRIGAFGFVEDGLLKFRILKGAEVNEAEFPIDGPGVTTRAARTGETQLIPDTRQNGDYLRVAGDTILSELAVPVKVGGEVVALINMEETKPNAFTDLDRRFLEIYAEHVSSAIVRLRLLESERRGREKLAALHASAMKLSEAPDLDSIWRIVVETLTGVLGFGVVSIGIFDGGSIRFTRTRGVTLPEGLSVRLDQPSISARAIRTLKTQLVNDVSTDPDYFSPLFSEDGTSVMKSDLVVPVILDGRAEAVINVESLKPGAFTEEDMRLVETLGTHASSAISRVRRVETLQRLVEEKTSELRDADQLAAVGRISAMVAHDLRSPIQVIRNATAIIKMKPNLTDKMLTTIEETCTRADKMLESFRSDTRDMPLNIEVVDLGALIRMILEESPPPAKVKVKLKVGKNLKAVQLDKFRVRRVLENLTSNAVDAMKGEGALRISAELKGGEVVVSVSDTGVGIPESELTKLFKAFYTTKQKGLGLGLAFCRRAVEAQGGRITVRSKPGEGTTFTFAIPQKPKD
jgi:PAS domain S-box-containing protein